MKTEEKMLLITLAGLLLFLLVSLVPVVHATDYNDIYHPDWFDEETINELIYLEDNGVQWLEGMTIEDHTLNDQDVQYMYSVDWQNFRRAWLEGYEL